VWRQLSRSLGCLHRQLQIAFFAIATIQQRRSQIGLVARQVWPTLHKPRLDQQSSLEIGVALLTVPGGIVQIRLAECDLTA
jgi:hypothetical protein